jgi:mannonate dehydratase
MHVGTQVGARNDADFEQWAQLGVLNICADLPEDPHDWTKDAFSRHRDKANSYGIELDMVQLPMSSAFQRSNTT